LSPEVEYGQIISQMQEYYKIQEKGR